MSDLPKYGLSIKPEMDWSAERLQFTTTIDGISQQLIRESICFKEKAVRETLIALGWTPPEEIHAVPPPPETPTVLGLKIVPNVGMPNDVIAILQKGRPPQFIKIVPPTET